MRLASRMERLGTETAFEVLAKAKALEAQGARSSTLRSARRTLRRSISSRRAARRCASCAPSPAPGVRNCVRVSPPSRLIAGAWNSRRRMSS
jgi:hypothetical protein